jgi:glycosyltransferase involved in cell wall biosynthesis
MTLEGRRVLFISYNGMLDPLGQSQVLPYLRQLAGRGVLFTLLSFERAGAFESNGSARCEKLRRELDSQGIEWHWLRYHQRPSLPATAYDVMAGIRYAQKLVRRNSIEMVHARGYIPATIALALKKKFGLKMVFDVRGLMAEEYVEAGHWRKGNSPYRVTKVMERRAFSASDGIVTLTQRIWPELKEWDGLRGRRVSHEVVPCCADLEVFKFRSADREKRRAQLNLQNSLVLVYSGSIGGWYLSDRMADFYVALLRKWNNAHFLWLTPGSAEIITELMTQRGIKPANYTVQRVASEEVPSYLSASDVGIAFYRPGFSKLATSPVKVTEYLACGLPFVINAGVGDSESLVDREGAGSLVSDFSGSEYARAIASIESFTAQTEQTRKRAREVAERLFDVRKVGVERYARLYESVLSS